MVQILWFLNSSLAQCLFEHGKQRTSGFVCLQSMQNPYPGIDESKHRSQIIRSSLSRTISWHFVESFSLWRLPQSLHNAMFSFLQKSVASDSNSASRH